MSLALNEKRCDVMKRYLKKIICIILSITVISVPVFAAGPEMPDFEIEKITVLNNINADLGTEVNADSFGDGLLEHNLALLEWKKKIRNSYPDLIIENCASGGLRADYASLSVSQIHSVSDQSDYKKMAYIASASGASVLPEQNAVWSYPLISGDKDAVAFNMSNTMLQRIHLSGDVVGWNDTQFALIREGIGCYKKIRNDIPKSIPFYPIGIPKYGDGWLCMSQKTDKKIRMTLWRMDDDKNSCHIPLEYNVSNVIVIYPSNYSGKVIKENGGIFVSLPKRFTAVVLETDILN